MNFHIREVHSDLYQEELEKQKIDFQEPAKQSPDKLVQNDFKVHEERKTNIVTLSFS